MIANEYQQQAHTFAKYVRNDYPAMALTEEVGEVMGKLAKYCRKYGKTLSEALSEARNPPTPQAVHLRADLRSELGDVLWQFCALCTELNFTIDETMKNNITKLTVRAARGTIVGSGDNR